MSTFTESLFALMRQDKLELSSEVGSSTENMCRERNDLVESSTLKLQPIAQLLYF